ncbi:MAG: hypothetical protein IK088_04415, partial [Lachnospiraceae bacterium]|nr:hypothetical protein [Lachnospiraceae bacterium]
MKKLWNVVMTLAIVSMMAVIGTLTVLADTPAQAGKVFGGYYTDDTFATPSTESTAFAKFVDENVLKAKYQLTYAANENDAATRLRVVTTVDSLHYQEVGFFVKVGDGAEQKFATKTVARQITGTDGLNPLEYEPSVFSEESQFFCAYNFTVPAAKFAIDLSFTPFWTTLDGTEVRGEERPIKILEAETFNNIYISNAAELKAFSDESQTKNFENWKVRLTADIDLNPGCTASLDGMTGAPEAWKPIGTTGNRFAGTFDGQGHTISGVYINAETAYQGLFQATDNSAVIKDFRLKNSYFTTTSSFLGSIAGNARGTFEKIYSNAFVSCTGTVQGGGFKGGGIGGLIGATADTGTVALRDCWFGGSVRITAQTSYLGGLIGLANNIPVTLENCLNTGELYHTWDGALSTAGVGGLVSFAANAAAVTITDSVNHSEPQYTSGSVIGLFVSKKDSGATIDITNGHSILYKLHGGTVSMSFVNGIADATYSTSSRQNKADVAGTKSLTTAKVSNLFSSDTAKGHWVCSTDSLPILAAFE